MKLARTALHTLACSVVLLASGVWTAWATFTPPEVPFAFASLPGCTTTVVGIVRYCKNCRNVTSVTVTSLGGTSTVNQEASGSGSGSVVVCKTVGSTTTWYLVGPFNTVAAA